MKVGRVYETVHKQCTLQTHIHCQTKEHEDKSIGLLTEYRVRQLEARRTHWTRLTT